MSDLVKIARERIDDTRVTHWVGCERDHRECLIQRMADEIERLRAERDEHAHWRRDLADKLHDRETDIIELRRQLAEAELDAERYRWLRNEANTARKCDPMVCIYPLDEQDLIDGDRLDVAIDAAMGGGDAG